ncbi:hypothetical protein C8F04DRAFT_1234202 [Mycena alexandri]|uniref:BHLH domain-containing protein n=1 Tax=Mycena alexandri TaxID=1745969 RepID=A0AAD6X0Q7_9AGAR|nr:hypothetical protein C8F04DRAFT_1234202 [Mycena alexandri]
MTLYFEGQESDSEKRGKRDIHILSTSNAAEGMLQNIHILRRLTDLLRAKMASAFAQYKPHVRQEGFHLPSPPPTADTPPHDPNLFASMGHNPAFNTGDFNDELASLIGQSSERSTHTQSPVGYNNNHDGSSSSSNGGDGYRPPPHTHNIFDISAPHSAQHQQHQQQHHHQGSASSTSSSFPSHFSLPASSTPHNANGNNGGASPNSNHGEGAGPTPQPYHFNSTLPALNSSMRYDPHPPPPSSAGGSYSMASPSSFRSPSPHASRSRSRSRPPSSHMAQQPTPAGGPTRTTRARRNGSLSSTSPPPRPVPQAIVIPSGHGSTNTGGAHRGSPYTHAPPAGQGWFGDYPHATPDSLPSLTSLPSLPSLHSLGSPHTLHSPHLGSLHGHGHMGGGMHGGVPLHHGGHGGMGGLHMHPHGHGGMYAPNGGIIGMNGHHGGGGGGGGYGSPVEAKFGGMGLGGMGMGPNQPPLGLPASLGSTNGTGSLIERNGLDARANNNNNSSSPSGNGNGNGGGAGEGKAESKASLLAHEKRRRRRESHNAVERRRRDNINEKISELGDADSRVSFGGSGVERDVFGVWGEDGVGLLRQSGTGNGNGNGQGQGTVPGLADDALLSPTRRGGPGAGDWPLVLPGGAKKEADEDGKDGKEGAVVKANKGMILRKSVEYIRYLQQLVSAQGARNRELEEQLKGFRGSSGSASPPSLGLSLGSASSSQTTNASVDAGMDGDFGIGGGGWGHVGMLAPMAEGEDEEQQLHELGGGGLGGLGEGMGMGMEVDGEEKRERGRRAKRSAGGGSPEKAVGVKVASKGRKAAAKKALQEVDEDEDEGSELSEDGMEEGVRRPADGDDDDDDDDHDDTRFDRYPRPRADPSFLPLSLTTPLRPLCRARTLLRALLFVLGPSLFAHPAPPLLSRTLPLPAQSLPPTYASFLGPKSSAAP